MGTEKFVWAEEFGGGDEAPFTGSLSISIELRRLMADWDRAESRLRSSGGKFRGCVSASNLLRREEDESGSVEWRESLE